MSFDRQAAIDAGYSEEEINAYLQSNEKKKRAEPVTVDSEPPAPGAPIEAVGMGGTEMATTAALGAAPYVLPAAGAAGAAYGGRKLYGAWQESAKAAQALADAKSASERGIMERATAKAAGRVPVGPAAPAAPAASSLLDQFGRPMAAPAPAAPAAPVKPVAPSMLQRGTDLARQMQQAAASKVMPAATGLLRGAIAPSMAMYTGSTGPAVPSVGRMRGMEINPLTGQGWTPDQIAQYERNFQAYDAQLGAPQMPR